MHFRYSRWDGTQDPFGPDVPAAAVLEELADEILMGGDADHALRRLLRRGMRGRFSGIEALRERLRQQREREEAALDLAGPLEEIRGRLEEILDRERTELSFSDDDDARMREAFLDALPPDAPGKIAELREYRFVDPVAQRMFDELEEHIREQVMGSYFRQLAEGMRSMTPEDIARFKDMLAELNGLIEMRERGRGHAGRLRGLHVPPRGPVPRRSGDPRRAAREHGAPHGGDERRAGVALARSSAKSSRPSPNR